MLLYHLLINQIIISKKSLSNKTSEFTSIPIFFWHSHLFDVKMYGPTLIMYVENIFISYISIKFHFNSGNILGTEWIETYFNSRYPISDIKFIFKIVYSQLEQIIIKIKMFKCPRKIGCCNSALTIFVYW